MSNKKDSSSPLHSPPSKLRVRGNADETGRRNSAAPDNHQTSSGRHVPLSNDTDNPATLLSRRIHQKQLKLQALREYASECPSHFAEEVRSPPPGRIPATPSSRSAKTPRATDEGQQASSPGPSLADMKGSPKPLHLPGSIRERPRTDPNPWGREVTSDFDAKRCRALQMERALAQATSKEALEIENKAKRLEKLPSLKASPEAARALSALARNHEPKHLALPRHFTFQQHSLPKTAGNNDVSINNSTDSTIVNKDSASSFEYPKTPRWGLFMYLLILVVAMVLIISPDPWEEFIQGYHLLISLFWGAIRFGKMFHHYCIPGMHVAAFRCQCALQETYFLCSHIWIALHAAFREMKRRQIDGGEISMKEIVVEWSAEDDRTTLLGFDDTSSLRDGGRLLTVDRQSQTYKMAIKTLSSTFGDKRCMKEKLMAFDLRACERGPCGDHSFYSTHDARSEESFQLHDILHTPAWPTLLGATSFVDISWLEIGHQTICKDQSWRGRGNTTLTCSADNPSTSIPVVNPIDGGSSERLELSNVSKPSLNWSRAGLTSLDAPDNEAVQELFDRVVDSCSVQVEQWLRTFRNDHVRCIGGLVRGANWITLGSTSDASSIV
jgi:hypothetical protein